MIFAPSDGLIPTMPRCSSVNLKFAQLSNCSVVSASHFWIQPHGQLKRLPVAFWLSVIFAVAIKARASQQLFHCLLRQFFQHSGDSKLCECGGDVCNRTKPRSAVQASTISRLILCHTTFTIRIFRLLRRVDTFNAKTAFGIAWKTVIAAKLRANFSQQRIIPGFT